MTKWHAAASPSSGDPHAKQAARPERVPSVSVIIPCYNYARYLRQCVESVLSQSGVEVRVLIIDDASTDDSGEIAAALANEDSRVELRAHEANLGHVRTYNEGLFLARETYTVLLDADDMLTPGSLSRACALMAAHPGVGLVYGHPLAFGDGPPRPLPSVAPARWKIWPGQEWFKIRCRLIENCIRSPEVVMRTSVLRKVGGFREELPHSGDLELWMRFALHSDLGYVAGPDQAFYRDHAAGLHNARFSGALADHAQISSAFDLLFRDYRRMIADSDRLAARVRRRLAVRALRLAWRAYDREPFDLNEALALEASAGNTKNDAHVILARCRLRMRKKLGAGLWRAFARTLNLMTIVPRRLNHLQHRRLQRAGLLL